VGNCSVKEVGVVDDALEVFAEVGKA